MRVVLCLLPAGGVSVCVCVLSFLFSLPGADAMDIHGGVCVSVVGSEVGASVVDTALLPDGGVGAWLLGARRRYVRSGAEEERSAVAAYFHHQRRVVSSCRGRGVSSRGGSGAVGCVDPYTADAGLDASVLQLDGLGRGRGEGDVQCRDGAGV